MNVRRNRCAIDEEFAARVHEQTVATFGEHLPHRVVVRDDGDDDIGLRRDLRQILASGATEFGCQLCRGFAIHIVNRRDMKAALLQPPRHVRAHPANANESNVHTLVVILSEAKDLTNKFRRDLGDSSLRSE